MRGSSTDVSISVFTGSGLTTSCGTAPGAHQDIDLRASASHTQRIDNSPAGMCGLCTKVSTRGKRELHTAASS
jgi:predicted small secreted protein